MRRMQLRLWEDWCFVYNYTEQIDSDFISFSNLPVARILSSEWQADYANYHNSFRYLKFIYDNLISGKMGVFLSVWVYLHIIINYCTQIYLYLNLNSLVLCGYWFYRSFFFFFFVSYEKLKMLSACYFHP